MRHRRFAAWSLSIPVMLAGTQVAHVFAYRLVYPQSQLRLRELLLTGHGYMSAGLAGRLGYLPMLLGTAAAVELIMVGAAVVASLRHRQTASVPPWAFALLPLVAFSSQECLERWLNGGGLPWWLVLQPAFQVGLLLQLPFALVAFLLARFLLRVAEGVARVFAADSPPVRVVFVERGLCWFALALCPLRAAPLASGHAERGPPL